MNCGAVANALVLKNFAGILSPEDRLGSPTWLGRWMEKPANELKFVAWVTVTGIPDCNDRIVFSRQPPSIAFSDAVRCKPMPVACGQVVDPAERSDIRHVSA